MGTPYIGDFLLFPFYFLLSHPFQFKQNDYLCVNRNEWVQICSIPVVVVQDAGFIGWRVFLYSL
jgi:hypothetical protein